MPKERWDADALFPDTIRARQGAFLDDVARFDAHFFNLSPDEAANMDPQQRLALETAWHALEDAGVDAASLAGTDMGVMVGAHFHDYLELLRLHRGRSGVGAYDRTGTGGSVIAGRIAHHLGIRGPTSVVDTACSSSGVALHLAASAIRNGECNAMLVGGVQVNLAPTTWTATSQIGMLSQAGKCRPFDADADGIVRGEGCAFLLLRKLDDARKRGDRILGLLAGSAVNHDGKSNGLTAPNGQAQEQVIRRAMAAALVGPEDVAYVHAHGTGTRLGDPVESAALAAVWRGASANTYVGSSKGAVGHTESVAGIVGVMIACMALARQQIPPTVGLATVNPLVTDAMRGTGLKVAPEGGLLAWPRGRASAASVSSFGYSGTNVHLIVRKADPASSPEPRRTDGRGALFVSARSKSALRALLVRYMRFFETTEAPFPLICRTAHAHAHACCHRRVVRVGCACAHRGDPCPRLRQRPDHPPPGCRVRAACSERCH